MTITAAWLFVALLGVAAAAIGLIAWAACCYADDHG